VRNFRESGEDAVSRADAARGEPISDLRDIATQLTIGNVANGILADINVGDMFPPDSLDTTIEQLDGSIQLTSVAAIRQCRMVEE
jgi:hypothetical protein